MQSAAKHAKSLDLETEIWDEFNVGDTRDCALAHIQKMRKRMQPPGKKCFISGGETTVRVVGSGKGGRNQEFVLTAALELLPHENIVILAGGTDGRDGFTDAAGAIADAQTTHRANSMKINPKMYLENNDTYHFFEQLSDLVKTEDTGTNVNDVRMILAES